MSHRCLWYRTPPTRWDEGLPIGNGVLAAMVCGEQTRDRLALNHEWFWEGKYRDRDFEPRWERLDEVRQLFFAGQVLEAGTLSNEILGGGGGTSGVPSRVDSYQPLGDLRLDFAGAPSDYRRELDLDEAVCTVYHRAGETQVVRQYLAHAAHPVWVVRLTAPGGGNFTVDLSLGRTDDPQGRIEPWTEALSFGFSGAIEGGVIFAVEARVVAVEANALSPATTGAGLRVEECRALTLLLAAAVSLDDSDPTVACRAQFAGVPTGWEELRATHVAEHQRRFGRVSLDLGAGPEDLPTDERLARLKQGGADPALTALYFDLGRYLLLASSWGCEVPANLQGKWNEDLDPAWDCDLHQDVNLQMNYWPAEVCNLAECTTPLFAFLERCVPYGRVAARKLYNCEGLWLPIQTDPWGRGTPESFGWDVWIGAGAWLSQHFWWRYEYGLDEAFLRERAYPFLKEVAAFYQAYLVRDPQGRLVPVPSQSPENYFVGGTTPVSLCVGASMDLELIWDCLTHCLRASERLGVDEDLRPVWRQILADLPPLRIGRWGQLQEWLEDYEEGEPGHRHLSHLVGLYPGEQITAEDTPELFEAARVSLHRRLAQGGGHTGWSRAWVICCSARLREGDAAYQHLKALLTDQSTISLLDLHPPRIFQIEGNLGATAGMAEILLQSYRGVIRLLPALPAAWPSGQVRGLVARGGFELDLHWAEGALRRAALRARHDLPCRLAWPADQPLTVTCAGQPVSVTREDAGTVSWPCAAGAEYELTPG